MQIHTGDVALYYEVHGEGAPLLWLHGFMGCGSDWKYVFDAPPEGYRLIAPDMRDHGQSTSPSGAYSHRQCARDVLALLDHLGIERVKAIGISGGGITLMHLAIAAASRVEAVVTVSAPPFFPERARAFQRAFSASMLREEEQALMHERHRQAGQLDRLFALARSFADSHDDVNFTPPLLGTIAAETLIVFGDRDPLYPLPLAVELRASIPRSYLWVVPNGGHAPVFGAARARFCETALAFLGGAWRA